MLNLILSHRLDILVDALVEQIENESIGLLEPRTILISEGSLKPWLFLEIAKRKKIAMGLKIISIESFYSQIPTRLELFCSLYQALCKSDDSKLQAYLKGSCKRTMDLADQLVPLFFNYGQFGPELFEEKGGDWQQQILHRLFVEGSWRFPVQTKIAIRDPLICFGIDYLAPIYWKAILEAPSVSIYQFSPCIEFWDDLTSARQRRRMNRYWKKRGASTKGQEALDDFLRQGPPLLANWGGLGRETLKQFDPYDLQIDERYPEFEPHSLLQQVQFDLLTFQNTEKHVPDDSIRVFLAGSSRLREVECLRDEIVRLQIPFHEMAVVAPDIEPYIPFIEFVFADLIPYRISGFDISPQSSFKQGLTRLLKLVTGRWSAEELLTLFETPSFYQKRGWDQEIIEQFRSWIKSAQIEWGRDPAHRAEILSPMVGDQTITDHGSWEKGIDHLLEAVIYLKPLQINLDRFEEFLIVLEDLKTVCIRDEKSLGEWAQWIEKIASTFFVQVDDLDAIAWNCLEQVLKELRECSDLEPFPLDPVLRLLNRPCLGQIHPTHLHAVHICPIDEGALLPTRALFCIGMDEESYPRLKAANSMDLLKGKVPSKADRDRYLFLRALFAARDFLRISWCHLSAEDGKPIGASLLVQELLSRTGVEPQSVAARPFRPFPKQLSFWSSLKSVSLPEGEQTISLADLTLLARHPWKFYLQKVQGIYLNEPLKESFDLQKGQLVRAQIAKMAKEISIPHGLLGEALQMEAADRASVWIEQMNEWGLEPVSLYLQAHCTTAYWENGQFIAPPIELVWPGLKIQIVGEIFPVSRKGLICTCDDKLGELLKKWPEALVAALVFQSNQVWMVKNKKCKLLPDPEKQLKLFVEYYLHCMNLPSPLLPDWADALLRKGSADLAKKMEKEPTFEDPIFEWIMQRTEMPCAEEIDKEWGPLLKQTFAALTELYPSRGKNGAEI